MKVRIGFVANSSSSSYVCDVCGVVEGGYDSTPSDFDMIGCDGGHLICCEHALEHPHKSHTNQYEDTTLFQHSCPLCMLVNVRDALLVRYLLNEIGGGRTKDDLILEVRKRFGTLKIFEEYLNQEK